MGGIPGKGVDDAAHNLGVLLGKARRHRQRVCGISVDIRKAFDRIRRDILWAKIKARLPNSQTIGWFERLYQNPHGKVKSGKETSTTTFPLTRGLKQGSPSSPFLFTLMIDLILTEWRTEVKRKLEVDALGINTGPGRYMDCLCYVGDTLLLANTS